MTDSLTAAETPTDGFRAARTRKCGRSVRVRIAALRAATTDTELRRKPYSCVSADAAARAITAELILGGECCTTAALVAVETIGGDWHAWNRVRVWATTTLRRRVLAATAA
jgi:hypothetical protein